MANCGRAVGPGDFAYAFIGERPVQLWAPCGIDFEACPRSDSEVAVYLASAPSDGAAPTHHRQTAGATEGAAVNFESTCGRCGIPRSFGSAYSGRTFQSDSGDRGIGNQPQTAPPWSGKLGPGFQYVIAPGEFHPRGVTAGGESSRAAHRRAARVERQRTGIRSRRSIIVELPVKRRHAGAGRLHDGSGVVEGWGCAPIAQHQSVPGNLQRAGIIKSPSVSV